MIVKIPLKELYGRFRNENLMLDVFLQQNGKSIFALEYDFNLLEQELITDGQKQPIVVERLGTALIGLKYNKLHPDYKYRVRGGNHRCYALNKLYGGDHLVDACIENKI